MSKAITAVAGAVLIAAAVAFPGPWTPVLIQAGNALLFGAAIGFAAQLLGPGSPRAPPMNGIGINYTGTLEPRRILYGQMKIGGLNAVPPDTPL